MRPLLSTLWIAIALGAVGCYAPPLVGDRAIGLTTFGPGETSPPLVWKKDDRRVIAEMMPPGRRVAVIECAIEFVTTKYETPTKRQAVMGGPFTPISALVEASGVFRRRVDYPQELEIKLARQVYEDVADQLAAHRVDVVDAGVVSSSPVYKTLDRAAVSRSPAIYYLNPSGSDVGRTNQFRIVPAWPLRVLTDRPGEMMAGNERLLLADIDADVALRLRLRVGLYRGRVSIERGSMIAIGTPDAGWRRIVSERSIVSPHPVAASEAFAPVRGRSYVVDWPEFRRTARLLLRDYAAAAWTATPRVYPDTLRTP